jgi:protein AroM
MTRVLATVTIGQAPRSDVVPIIDRYVPAAVPRIHRGLLDGLGIAEIEARYRPAASEPVLVTRLADGHVVELSSAKAERGVAAVLEGLEAEGCDVILLLCTGTFRRLECRRAFLVEPDRIIPYVAAGLVRDRRLGVVVPTPSQIRSEAGKWRPLTQAPLYASASPYTDDLAPLRQAGAELAAEGARALLLDCIGFTERHREALAAATGLPVILSNAVAAKAVGELLAA